MVAFNGQDQWGINRPYRDDPVFEVSFDSFTTYPNGDKLPDVWITKPIKDGKGGFDGRTYSMIYPLPSFYDEFFPGTDPSDADGSIALHYGSCYYDEGMGYTDSADHDKRVDCFRAAEMLYRHSAGKGNAVANLCLGYMYRYDRCEGDYWIDPLMQLKGQAPKTYPRENRAFECFSLAAQAGIPEACYKLICSSRRQGAKAAIPRLASPGNGLIESS